MIKVTVSVTLHARCCGPISGPQQGFVTGTVLFNTYAAVTSVCQLPFGATYQMLGFAASLAVFVIYAAIDQITSSTTEVV